MEERKRTSFLHSSIPYSSIRTRAAIAPAAPLPYPPGACLFASRAAPMPRSSLASVAAAVCLALGCALGGCKSAPKAPAVTQAISPSNFRDWAPDQTLLPTAEIGRRRVTIHNVRNCRRLAPDEYVVDYYDKSFDLAQVRAVDFITMPFGAAPGMAHTLVSFEIGPPEDAPDAEPEHLAISVEVRKEKGEEVFNPLLGAMRQYEIMYVVADERDVIARQTNVYKEDVYVYRTTAPPRAAQDLLVDMLERANQLAAQPEFYDLVTNNCTTNIVRHVNRIRPGAVPYDLGVLFPGYSDQMAYAEGLIAGEGSFQAIKARANITRRAQLAAGSDDFSRAIRR